MKKSIKSGLLVSAAAAVALFYSTVGAAALYLDCRTPGSENNLYMGFYVAMDYAAGTVVTISHTDLTSSPPRAAQVSDTAVQWDVQVPAQPGIFHRFRLDRLTGTLTGYQSDDPQFVNTWNCSVVDQLQKPQPKF